MGFKVDSLLTSAAVILSLLSAITTAEGFYLFMNEKSLFYYILSGAFAFAVGSVMVFCCLKVQAFFREGKAIPLVTVFIAFASLSMFFNFNSIHGKFTKESSLNRDVKEIARNTIGLRIRSTSAIMEKFHVTSNKRTLDSLKFLEAREIADQFRPGKGAEWRKISLHRAAAEGMLKSSEEQSSPYISQIEQLSQRADKISSSKTLSSTDFEYIAELYNEIGEITQNVVPNYSFKKQVVANRNGSPDYSLVILQRYYRNDPSLTDADRTAIQLSLFISFLLDFPVFIATVMLSWKANRKRKNIFDTPPVNVREENAPRKINWN